MFIRFLLGLSLGTNQNLLKELLKKTITQRQSRKQFFNLFHCLNELNDHSPVKEVKMYLQPETLTFEKISPPPSGQL